ncbi:MAG: N-acetylmuramoyl-L-alanine amidase [Planctomycetota bacterium]
MREGVPTASLSPRQHSSAATLALLLAIALLPGCLANRQLPDDYSAVERGDRAFAAGDLRSATQAYSAAASEGQPLRVRGRALLGLGRCELSAGTPDRAARLLQTSAEFLNGTARFGQALQSLGEAYIEIGSYRNAQTTLERAFTYQAGVDRARTSYLLELLTQKSRDVSGNHRYREFARGFDRNSREAQYWQSKITPVPDESIRRDVRAREPKIAKAPKATPKTSTVTLRTRKQWGARKMRRNSNAMGKVKAITIHHTGEEYALTVGSDREVKAYLRRLQKYVQNEKRWADIGYHYLVDPRGVVWEGRPANKQGAHAGNPTLNRGNVGVALIGNFDRVHPTSKQLEALSSLLVKLCKQHKVPLNRVYTHSERRLEGGLADTACPGKHLQKRVPNLKKQLANAGIARSGGGFASRFLTLPDIDCECCTEPTAIVD